ncbi:ras-specific guanine nucleotide-releasing factor 1-like isoform X2 [Equus przewalskii]
MEREGLVQKYLHLLQMVEVEKIVAKQLRQQVKDGEIDIQWLKAEEVKVDVSVTSTIEMRQQAQGGEGTTEARHGLSRAPLPSSHGGF